MTCRIPQPGTRYLHADNLSSTDVVTDEGRNVLERRSYDPFGQRRNPDWGRPPPAVFSNLTSAGFTGHESDGELGLVNMKGRIFDPKIGRFLTMDPVVQAPLSGQSWNPYSYVFNNPLSFVDPSGFDGDKEPIMPTGSTEKRTPTGVLLEVTIFYPPREPKGAPEQTGAYVPPVDVSTLGSGSGVLPSPAAFVPPDWDKDPFVQGVGGFLGGLCLGAVPFAGVGQQFLDAAEVLPHGTPEARLGLAIGEIFGGLFTAASGLAGEVGGGALSLTGVGALAGVPVIVVSTTAVVGGVGNVMAGINGLASTGSGSGPVHHVMTNKNDTSTDRGGPWTPRFEAMAKRAGMTLEDAANKVEVPGHKGPHPEAYHQAVFERLSRATEGLSGDAYSRAFRAQLDAIRTEAATVGTNLNSLLTKR